MAGWRRRRPAGAEGARPGGAARVESPPGPRIGGPARHPARHGAQAARPRSPLGHPSGPGPLLSGVVCACFSRPPIQPSPSDPAPLRRPARAAPAARLAAGPGVGERSGPAAAGRGGAARAPRPASAAGGAARRAGRLRGRKEGPPLPQRGRGAEEARRPGTARGKGQK